MRILLPVDGSRHSRAAVAFVASRTTLIGAQPEIVLLNVQLPMPPRAAAIAGRKAVEESFAWDADRSLKPASAALKMAGLRVTARYVVGQPGTAIAAAAAQERADLIVMGSHGRTAAKGVLFGSVTNAVLAACTTPLLAVRDAAAPRRDSLKIGIAVDGSAYGLAAVRYALKHRDLWGASPRFVLIHVVPDPFSIGVPGRAAMPTPSYAAERVLAVQAQAFEAVTAPLRMIFERANESTEAVRLVGNNAGDEIAAYAQRARLDVLVMGSHGHGAFKAAALGSVATRVAARCRIPLLLIRRPQPASPK